MTLTVHVVVDTITLPAWVLELLCKIRSEPYLMLGNLCLYDSKARVRESEVVQSQPSMVKRLANRIVDFIDKPRMSSEPLAPAVLPEIFIKKSQPLVDSFTESTKIDENSLLLWLCKRPLDDCPEAVKYLPAFTVWETHYARSRANAYAALLTGAACIEVFIWQRASPGSVSRLYSAHALPRQSYSVSDINTYSIACLPEVLISRLNWVAKLRSPMPMRTAPVTAALSSETANTHLAATLDEASSNDLLQIPSMLLRYMRQLLLNKFAREHWHIRYRLQARSHSLLPDVQKALLDDYTAIVPPKDRMWADPHVVSRDGVHHIFFEEFVFRQDKGHISALCIAGDGTVSKVRTVLNEDFHLSYPFVFHFEGHDYMVPETASAGAVRLYRAEQFPSHWTYLHDLIGSVNAADSTLFFYNGLWWMFNNGMSHPSVAERDTLNLYYSHNPVDAEWTPHPLNPIITGIDCARMAGRVYEESGLLYRPFQYGVKRYGHGFGVARIDLLDTQRYSETPIVCKTPGYKSKLNGCHTFTHTPELTVIDALKFNIR